MLLFRLVVTLETSEMSVIFVFTTKTIQPRPQFGLVAIWPRAVVWCRDFILRSVATLWVMSLVGITLAGPPKRRDDPRPNCGGPSRLQIDPALSLAKAISQAWQSATMKKQ